MNSVNILLLITILVTQSSVIKGKLIDRRGDEAKYTSAERIAFINLRKLITPELYADYMHRDEYLIPWLRTKKLNVEAAATMLKANLKWRLEENIDNLPNESFPQFEGAYPVNLEGHDCQGRPVALFPEARWNVRKAALAGQMKQLLRYAIKHNMELPTIKARQEGQRDWSNAIQFLFLVDMAGYNLYTHLCVCCIEFPLTFVRTYESRYPQTRYASLAINTPRIFDPVLAMVRPFMSQHLSDGLHFLGPNKMEWKKVLDQYVHSDQLPTEFGGTRTWQVQ